MNPEAHKEAERLAIENAIKALKELKMVSFKSNHVDGLLSELQAAQTPKSGEAPKQVEARESGEAVEGKIVDAVNEVLHKIAEGKVQTNDIVKSLGDALRNAGIKILGARRQGTYIYMGPYEDKYYVVIAPEVAEPCTGPLPNKFYRNFDQHFGSYKGINKVAFINADKYGHWIDGTHDIAEKLDRLEGMESHTVTPGEVWA